MPEAMTKRVKAWLKEFNMGYGDIAASVNATMHKDEITGVSARVVDNYVNRRTLVPTDLLTAIRHLIGPKKERLSTVVDEQNMRRGILAEAQRLYATATGDSTIKGFAKAIDYNKDYLVTVINAESPVSASMLAECRAMIEKYKYGQPNGPTE